MVNSRRQPVVLWGPRRLIDPHFYSFSSPLFYRLHKENYGVSGRLDPEQFLLRLTQ